MALSWEPIKLPHTDYRVVVAKGFIIPTWRKVGREGAGAFLFVIQTGCSRVQGRQWDLPNNKIESGKNTPRRARVSGGSGSGRRGEIRILSWSGRGIHVH